MLRFKGYREKSLLHVLNLCPWMGGVAFPLNEILQRGFGLWKDKSKVTQPLNNWYEALNFSSFTSVAWSHLSSFSFEPDMFWRYVPIAAAFGGMCIGNSALSCHQCLTPSCCAWKHGFNWYPQRLLKCVEGMLTIVADFLGAIGSGTGILSGLPSGQFGTSMSLSWVATWWGWQWPLSTSTWRMFQARFLGWFSHSISWPLKGWWMGFKTVIAKGHIFPPFVHFRNFRPTKVMKCCPSYWWLGPAWKRPGYHAVLSKMAPKRYYNIIINYKLFIYIHINLNKNINSDINYIIN